MGLYAVLLDHGDPGPKVRPVRLGSTHSISSPKNSKEDGMTVLLTKWCFTAAAAAPDTRQATQDHGVVGQDISGVHLVKSSVVSKLEWRQTREAAMTLLLMVWTLLVVKKARSTMETF